ncbi:MAG: thiol-disulfide oxidoreductase DCC family protein [Phycisphaerae bacterium]
MKTSSNTYVLFYDGSCGLCRHIARFVCSLRLRAPLRIVNAADPRQLRHYPQLSPHQAMQSVHLLTPSGKLHRGFDAVIALTRLIPFVRFLAPFMSLRISRWIGNHLYEFVTHHRHQISHLLALE